MCLVGFHVHPVHEVPSADPPKQDRQSLFCKIFIFLKASQWQGKIADGEKVATVINSPWSYVSLFIP